MLIHGAANAGGRLEKLTLFGGNKQPTTKLCFIWEEHRGGFQELQINSIYSSFAEVIRSPSQVRCLVSFSFTMNRGASREEIPCDLNKRLHYFYVYSSEISSFLE